MFLRRLCRELLSRDVMYGIASLSQSPSGPLPPTLPPPKTVRGGVRVAGVRVEPVVDLLHNSLSLRDRVKEKKGVAPGVLLLLLLEGLLGVSL
jgi:hypothetical protein